MWLLQKINIFISQTNVLLFVLCRWRERATLYNVTYMVTSMKLSSWIRLAYERTETCCSTHRKLHLIYCEINILLLIYDCYISTVNFSRGLFWQLMAVNCYSDIEQLLINQYILILVLTDPIQYSCVEDTLQGIKSVNNQNIFGLSIVALFTLLYYLSALCFVMKLLIWFSTEFRIQSK